MSQLKTLDIDVLTLRTVYAKTATNEVIPANYTLVTDGQGGTQWSTVNNAGIPLSFSKFMVDGTEYLPSQTSNTFGFQAGPGLGSLLLPSSVTFFSKGFQTLQVVGGNSIKAYDSILYPTVNITGSGGVAVTADPITHTLTIGAAPAAISTGIYSFYRSVVYPNVSSISSGLFSNTDGATVFTANDPSTSMRFVGLGDIILTGDATNNATYIGISSFTAIGYSTLQGTAYSAFSRTLSAVSTAFTAQDIFTSTAANITGLMSSLSSSVTAQVSTMYSTFSLLSQYTSLSSFTNQLYLDSLSHRSSLKIDSFFGTPQFDVIGGNVPVVFSSGFLSVQYLNLWKNPSTSVSIRYSPAFIFDSVILPAVRYVSTFLVASNSILPESVITRPLFATNTVSFNPYVDTLEMLLPWRTISTSLYSTYTIVHRVDVNTYLQGAGVTNATSPTNSLIVDVRVNKTG